MPAVAEDAVNPFSDVEKGSFYYDAVLWAVKNNITVGTSATTFEPNAVCNRAQIVTFLWRANGSEPPTLSMQTQSHGQLRRASPPATTPPPSLQKITAPALRQSPCFTGPSKAQAIA